MMTRPHKDMEVGNPTLQNGRQTRNDMGHAPVSQGNVHRASLSPMRPPNEKEP